MQQDNMMMALIVVRKLTAETTGSRSVMEFTNACLQTHGSLDYKRISHRRKFRETRLYQVAPISTNFILSYISEHELGHPGLSNQPSIKILSD